MKRIHIGGVGSLAAAAALICAGSMLVRPHEPIHSSTRRQAPQDPTSRQRKRALERQARKQ